MRSPAVCVLALLLSTPVLAQSQTPPADAPAETAKPDPQEKICVDRNPTANTRMNSQRVCRTREEWEKRGGVPK